QRDTAAVRGPYGTGREKAGRRREGGPVGEGGGRVAAGITWMPASGDRVAKRNESRPASVGGGGPTGWGVPRRRAPAGSHASASGRVVALHERPLRLGGAAGARAGRVLRDSAGPGRGRKLLRPRQVRHHSNVRPHQLQRAVELPPDLHAVREDHQVRADRVGHHARDRLYGLLFSRLPRAQHPLADGPVSALHRALLDIQRHPDDLVDPAFGPPWAPQPVVDRARPRRSPAGVSSIFVLIYYVYMFTS